MATKLENLTKSHRTSRKKRLGRGNASGKGTYAARGLKGQRSRAGGKGGLKKRSMMKQLIKKMPKLGGFKSPNPPVATLTFTSLESKFNDGDTVSIATLREKKLIKSIHKNAKIVATGKLSKKLIFDHIRASKNALEIIKAAGGKINISNESN